MPTSSVSPDSSELMKGLCRVLLRLRLLQTTWLGRGTDFRHQVLSVILHPVIAAWKGTCCALRECMCSKWLLAADCSVILFQMQLKALEFLCLGPQARQTSQMYRECLASVFTLPKAGSILYRQEGSQWVPSYPKFHFRW